MDHSTNNGRGAPDATQEENPPAPASPDRSNTQESTVSSLSPNNSPDGGARTQTQNTTRNNVRPAPIDTSISLADSIAVPSPPSLQSIGTEEKMTMLENLSRMQSARRANRSAAAVAAAEAEESGDAPFHSSMYRPGPGFPGRTGRPPLSPTFDPPAGVVKAAESAATSNSGKYMSAEEISLKQEEESFYNAPANEAGDDNIWGLLSGVMGNVYEW